MPQLKKRPARKTYIINPTINIPNVDVCAIAITVGMGLELSDLNERYQYNVRA